MFVELKFVEFIEIFCGDLLLVGDIVSVEVCWLVVCDFVDELEIFVGNVVDFWIEVVLFFVVGYIVFVYGFGDIVQVYIVDEWVVFDQLQYYVDIIYCFVVCGNV